MARIEVVSLAPSSVHRRDLENALAAVVVAFLSAALEGEVSLGYVRGGMAVGRAMAEALGVGWEMVAWDVERVMGVQRGELGRLVRQTVETSPDRDGVLVSVAGDG